MERLYKALMWLAVVALVMGLVTIYLLGNPASNQYPQGIAFDSADGLIAAFFKMLYAQRVFIVSNLSGLLGGGVVTLAAVLAWVNRRRAWLIALVVLELLTLAWPLVAQTWLIWQNTHASPLSQAQTQAQVETFNLVNLSVPLIPIALALVFALIHRKSLAATTDMAADAESDAELGVVRSAL